MASMIPEHNRGMRFLANFGSRPGRVWSHARKGFLSAALTSVYSAKPGTAPARFSGRQTKAEIRSCDQELVCGVEHPWCTIPRKRKRQNHSKSAAVFCGSRFFLREWRAHGYAHRRNRKGKQVAAGQDCRRACSHWREPEFSDLSGFSG